MKDPIFHRMYDYDRRLLPNRHLAELEEGVSTLEEARLRTGASIGYPGWGLIYHLLLAHLAPERENVVVETGTNWGCTTIIIAQALIDSGRPGRVHSIEIDPDAHAKARANVEAAGVADRVTLHLGDSREKLGEILSDAGSVRAAFLDGSHFEPDVLAEFAAVLPKLDDDGLVVFDNTYPIASDNRDQRVNGALRTILAEHGGNLVNLPYVSWFTPGLAIWQKHPQLDAE